jgi:hypothetical protein
MSAGWPYSVGQASFRPTSMYLGLFFLLAGAFVPPAFAQALPEGSTGIAARYPGDVGIGSDPSVVFADDFESYAAATNLATRWTRVYQRANVRIATEPGNYYAGSKAIEFTVPRQSNEVTNTVIKSVSPPRDILFLRYYGKFDAALNVVGSSHNGSTISANYCCPGVKADGHNKFFVSYEAGREDAGIPTPGKLKIYVYHPDQRDVWGDHFYPTGEVSPFTAIPGNFGPAFVARPDVVPQLGRWYAYELMVKVNTPGLRDGRIAMWLDGKLIADFPNVRLRETTDLKIDQFDIDLHVRSNTRAVARKWLDNVVAATSYIGPMTRLNTSANESRLPHAPR